MAPVWSNGVFDSIEMCLYDAKKGGYCDNKIAISECEEFEIQIDAYFVLEMLQNQAYEECGDVVVGWDFEEKTIDELSKRLSECVKNWIVDTKQEPNFYKIKNTRVIDFFKE